MDTDTIIQTGPGAKSPTLFKGLMFSNPDRESHLNFGRIVNPANPKPWGNIITPDEMRMIYFMGNSRLVTMTGAYLDDDMLQGWIDQTVFAIGEELTHDIYPRMWRHRPIDFNVPREIEPWAEWEDPYDYKNENVYDHFYLRTRHRPILRMEKWDLYNPYNNHQILDLLHNGSKINYATGDLRSVIVGRNALLPSGLGIRAWRLYQRGVGNVSIPGSYYLDYASGYDAPERVPMELRELCAKVLAIKIMSAYGDGIVGGLANFSISVGVLSESVGTTMSATNAYFGARIGQFKDEIKVWIENGGYQRYRGLRLAIL